jgi:hypothetical protein
MTLIRAYENQALSPFGIVTPEPPGKPSISRFTLRFWALQRQRSLSDECFIFSLRFAEAPAPIRQPSGLPVKE